MPDSKITALTSISTSTDPANDPLVIVDVSDTSMAATGTTKKVTLNQLLGASGTATLASATITGDLTVDTSTLKVDSANNRVGIGTATPSSALHLRNASGTGIFTQYQDTGGINYVGIDNGLFRLANTTAQDLLTIAQSGVFSFLDGAGGTRMTLNATGLGVGASPGYKLHVGGYSSANIAPDAALVRSSSGTTIQSGPNLLFSDGTSVNNVVLQNTQGRFGIWNYGAGVWNERLSVDSSGNVGIGVTPSATWASNRRALQIGGLASGAVALNGTGGSGEIFFNSFFNTSTQNICVVTGGTGKYDFNVSTVGAHSWSVGTGTAGNAFTFTQAMTLDASGNLLVGTTTNIGAARLRIAQTGTSNAIYVSGDFNTPLINFCGAGLFRSDGAYLSLQTNSTGGVIYITPNTGGVYISPGNTSWTANSDERLKDIIEPISNAVQKVGSLRSVIGKWKTDPDGVRRSFLIAQDAETVFPEVVDKNADGMLGIRYSEVIPLLVAAIKELTARVQTLETR